MTPLTRKARAHDGSHALPREALLPFRHGPRLHTGDTRAPGVAEQFHNHVASPSVDITPA
jgi:hypothetical protein